jgi:hypothetical protein
VPPGTKLRAKIAAKKARKLILDGPSLGGSVGDNSCRTDPLRKSAVATPSLGSLKPGEENTKFSQTW